MGRSLYRKRSAIPTGYSRIFGYEVQPRNDDDLKSSREDSECAVAGETNHDPAGDRRTCAHCGDAEQQLRQERLSEQGLSCGGDANGQDRAGLGVITDRPVAGEPRLRSCQVDELIVAEACMREEPVRASENANHYCHESIEARPVHALRCGFRRRLIRRGAGVHENLHDLVPPRARAAAIGVNCIA